MVSATDITPITIDEAASYLASLSTKENDDIPVIFINSDDAIHTVLLEIYSGGSSITVSKDDGEDSKTATQIFSEVVKGKTIPVELARRALESFWDETTEIDVMGSITIVKQRKLLSVHTKVNTVLQPIQDRLKVYLGTELLPFFNAPYDFFKCEAYQNMDTYVQSKTGASVFCCDGVSTDDELKDRHTVLVGELKEIYRYGIGVMVGGE